MYPLIATDYDKWTAFKSNMVNMCTYWSTNTVQSDTAKHPTKLEFSTVMCMLNNPQLHAKWFGVHFMRKENDVFLIGSWIQRILGLHLQEESDMTSKRRKLQYMLLPVNLAATYNTWLSNFVVNYKYEEKFWDDHRFLSFSFYIKIGSLCLNDFSRFSGLPDKKTLFLKEGTCIISKEFAPKITKHSKIIV